MTDDKKHQNGDNDIIIKDHDGNYKIFKDGKFVPLDEVEMADVVTEQNIGPKRMAVDNKKIVSVFERSIQRSHQSKEIDQNVPVNKPILSTPTGLNSLTLQQQAEALIEKSEVTFASGEIRNRVINALIAHIKGVRKPFETKENLSKSVAEGGSGLPEKDVERLLVVSGITVKTVVNPAETVSLPPPPRSTPAPKHLVPVGREIQPPSKLPVTVPSSFKQKESVKPESFVSAPTVVAQPSVVDIKPPKQTVVGLAGELRYTLATWRRLSPNPKDRNTKIENQLGVLEQEDYPLRIKGINAWRESEVFNLYLDAGRQSLQRGIGLQKYLNEGGSGLLSWPEWEAIAQLNKQIRA